MATDKPLPLECSGVLTAVAWREEDVERWHAGRHDIVEVVGPCGGAIESCVHGGASRARPEIGVLKEAERRCLSPDFVVGRLVARRGTVDPQEGVAQEVRGGGQDLGEGGSRDQGEYSMD